METNVKGTMRVCEGLKSCFRNQTRVVNVCSRAGKSRIVAPSLRQRLLDPNLSMEDLVEHTNSFPKRILDGSHSSKGWPISMYGVSKLLEAMYTRILARDLGRTAIVSACCPG